MPLLDAFVEPRHELLVPRGLLALHVGIEGSIPKHKECWTCGCGVLLLPSPRAGWLWRGGSWIAGQPFDELTSAVERGPERHLGVPRSMSDGGRVVETPKHLEAVVLLPASYPMYVACERNIALATLGKPNLQMSDTITNLALLEPARIVFLSPVEVSLPDGKLVAVTCGICRKAECGRSVNNPWIDANNSSKVCQWILQPTVFLKDAHLVPDFSNIDLVLESWRRGRLDGIRSEAKDPRPVGTPHVQVLVAMGCVSGVGSFGYGNAIIIRRLVTDLS